jgi:hypothetical protein
MNNYLTAHAAAGNEGLSESLNFTAPQMAGYARKRAHRTLPPQGGAEYGVQGSGKTTTIRFRISGDEFLDPSTLAIKFKVSNSKATNPLLHVAPMYGYFQRFRVLINGYTVEEISDFHRTCSLIDACSSRDGVYQQRCKQGWWGDAIGRNAAGGLVTDNEETFVVPFRASGLFNNFGNKFLPLKYIPQMDIELELASLDEILLCLNPLQNAGAGTGIVASDITISDVRLLFDTIMLDSSIEDQFYQHLEAGNTLDIPFASWRNTRQVMTANNFYVQTACNVKSARSIFFSVIKNNTTTGNPEDMDVNEVAVLAPTGLLAAMAPTTGAAGMFYRHGIKNLEIQVGSNVYPDSPVSSTAEFFHYLSVAWNKHHTYSDPLGITWQEYNNDLSGPYTQSFGNFGTSDLALTDLGPYPSSSRLNDGTVALNAVTNTNLDTYAAVRNYQSRFIVGFNLEKLLDMYASGLSLENDVIQIKCDCKGTAATASIMLHYNCILRVGRGTIDLLERA